MWGRLEQLYSYRKPNSMIDSQYGKIPYYEWLAREKERIEKDPTRIVELRTIVSGRVALFVNLVA